jgi:hypothetical protein
MSQSESESGAVELKPLPDESKITSNPVLKMKITL